MAKLKPWMKMRPNRNKPGEWIMTIDRRGKWTWIERQLLRRGDRLVKSGAGGGIVITRAR
jgi:hypothetical protein